MQQNRVQVLKTRGGDYNKNGMYAKRLSFQLYLQVKKESCFA